MSVCASMAAFGPSRKCPPDILSSRRQAFGTGDVDDPLHRQFRVDPSPVQPERDDAEAAVWSSIRRRPSWSTARTLTAGRSTPASASTFWAIAFSPGWRNGAAGASAYRSFRSQSPRRLRPYVGKCATGGCSAAHQHWLYALCVISLRLNGRRVNPKLSMQRVIDIARPEGVAA